MPFYVFFITMLLFILYLLLSNHFMDSCFSNKNRSNGGIGKQRQLKWEDGETDAT